MTMASQMSKKQGIKKADEKVVVKLALAGAEGKKYGMKKHESTVPPFSFDS